MSIGSCEPFEAAMTILGRKWSGAIVRAMLAGADRFGDVRRAVPGLTDAVLSTRLRELCDRGLVERTVIDDRPVSVSYTLTKAGRDLRPVLNAIEKYGRTHADLLGEA